VQRAYCGAANALFDVEAGSLTLLAFWVRQDVRDVGDVVESAPGAGVTSRGRASSAGLTLLRPDLLPALAGRAVMSPA